VELGPRQAESLRRWGLLDGRAARSTEVDCGRYPRDRKNGWVSISIATRLFIRGTNYYDHCSSREMDRAKYERDLKLMLAERYHDRLALPLRIQSDTTWRLKTRVDLAGFPGAWYPHISDRAAQRLAYDRTSVRPQPRFVAIGAIGRRRFWKTTPISTKHLQPVCFCSIAAPGRGAVEGRMEDGHIYFGCIGSVGSTRKLAEPSFLAGRDRSAELQS